MSADLAAIAARYRMHGHRTAATLEARWHWVPPGKDGTETHHDDLPIRWLRRTGCVIVWDRNQRRQVVARCTAATLSEATQIGIETLLTLDMEEDARREIEARERDRRRGFTRNRVADRDVVREVRQRLDEPSRVVHALGLEKGARRQSRGLMIVCPWHEDRSPSCSVRVAVDGTIACKCHGCGATGDVLGLVAAAHRLDVRRDFRRVLEIAASLAGVSLQPARAA